MEIRFKKLSSLAKVPQHMSEGASGCDVFAALGKTIDLAPSERTAIPTGLAVEIPLGWELQVRPRSGLAFKQGLTVINAPGTIDSDFRGELKILVANLGLEKVSVAPGQRIAQLILQRVEMIQWVEADDLSATVRSEGGFGSTGV